MSALVRDRRVVTSRVMLAAILAVAAVLALITAVLFQAPGLLGRTKVLTDFDAFHIAGTLAARGQADEAYRASDMLAAQRAIAGTRSFMPWTYPPAYTLFVETLARLPIGLSYLLFITSSFAFYLLVLRRIAGGFLPGVLIAILPTVVLTIRTGQNGFLTAALIGCFLLAFRDRRTVAGIPLGLMSIKPHLAIGIALLALLDRRWTLLALAAATVIATSLVATVAFGPGIWPAFLGGLREAGRFLAAGYYKLFRMSSVYACVRAFGGSAGLALALQIGTAIAAIGLLFQVWRSACQPRTLAAAACCASLFVSPYCYDYDLTVLGLAIAFLLPEVVRRASAWEMIGLLALSWIATGYGLAAHTFVEARGGGAVTTLQASDALSLTAPALLLFMAAGFTILRRPVLADGGTALPDAPETSGLAPAISSDRAALSEPSRFE